MKHELTIPTAGRALRAELRMADHPAAIVVFVHGCGTDRHDALNRFVAAGLVRAGFATLLVDLLEDCEAHERHDVFDVETQAKRLVAVNEWLRTQPATRHLDIGYFGTDVGSGVVLLAAAKAPQGVRAVVARGGRPDSALHELHHVAAPTLFIASESGSDRPWTEAAFRAATGVKELVHVPAAGDAFREPGARDIVLQRACRWYGQHLASALDRRIHTLESELRQRHPGYECRVTVEEREPHAYERRRFNVRLDVSGKRALVVNREHDADPAAALAAAFSEANRELAALEAAERPG
jgi:putative phosphoribosyl transferase